MKGGSLVSPPGQPTRSWLARLGSMTWSGDRIGLPLVLIFLLAGLSLLSPPFRRIDNFILILLDASIIGVVAAGQTMVILIGGIDLSVGSIVGLTGVVAALLMTEGVGSLPPLHPYLAIGVALALGALIGSIHGLLIAKRNMPPFIVTLGTLSVLKGVALVITNASSINALPDQFKWISDAYLGIFPMPGLIMLLTFLSLGYILRQTKFGRYVFAIGGNETSARLSGVPVDRYKLYVYMLSGLLSALAGIILIARIDTGAYTNGEGYELRSVAAVIIGGTSLGGGVGSLWGTLEGVLIMAVVSNGLVMLDISTMWRSIVIGSIILLAVFLDTERRRMRQAAPRVQINQAGASATYLEGLVTQVTELIKRRFGSHSRLYLIDPKLDNLIEYRPDQPVTVRAESIAGQVKASGRPVMLNDLDKQNGRVNRLSPNIQSVAAVPLTASGQMFGVLEIQNPVPYGFRPETIQQLIELVQEISEPLRNAWLLECGWLADQTRTALRHLWDDAYLGQCTLAEWAFPDHDFSTEAGPAARGDHLRQWLLDAIDQLKPEESHSAARPLDRRYEILRLTYLENLTVDEVIKELTLSRRQYFYVLKDAVAALAHLLVRAHQTEP
jgi:ribose transport system permease protein